MQFDSEPVRWAGVVRPRIFKLEDNLKDLPRFLVGNSSQRRKKRRQAARGNRGQFAPKEFFRGLLFEHQYKGRRALRREADAALAGMACGEEPIRFSWTEARLS